MKHRHLIKTGNFTIYNSEKNKKRTLGIVLKVPARTSKQIKNALLKNIPLEVRSKILFQPPEGYHFTLQWTPERYLRSMDVNIFTQKLRDLLQHYYPMEGNLYLPYFGSTGLYGIFKTKPDNGVLQMRQDIHKLWGQFRLPTGSNSQNYDLMYISVARYIERFSPGEVEKLGKLYAYEIPNIILNEVSVVVNDKFMTSENTKIIDSLILGKIWPH